MRFITVFWRSLGTGTCSWKHCKAVKEIVLRWLWHCPSVMSLLLFYNYALACKFEHLAMKRIWHIQVTCISHRVCLVLDWCLWGRVSWLALCPTSTCPFPPTSTELAGAGETRRLSTASSNTCSELNMAPSAWYQQIHKKKKRDVFMIKYMY